MSSCWLKLPNPKDGTYQALITSWLIEVSDRVMKGQIIGEAETAKTTFELVSPATGVVSQIRILVGRQVDFGTLLVEIQFDS